MVEKQYQFSNLVHVIYERTLLQIDRDKILSIVKVC